MTLSAVHAGEIVMITFPTALTNPNGTVNQKSRSMELPQTGVKSIYPALRDLLSSSALELQGATSALPSSHTSWTTDGQRYGLNSSSSKMELIILPTFTDHFQISE